MAALRRLDPALEEVGASLGHGPVARSGGPSLPAISPAVLGGSLLVGLHLLAEYGALQLLNYPTLTTAILEQYASTFNGPPATLLAAVLVAFCLVLLGLELLLRGARAGAPGRVAARPPAAVGLGRAAPVVLPSWRPWRSGARRAAGQPGALAAPRLDDRGRPRRAGLGHHHHARPRGRGRR